VVIAMQNIIDAFAFFGIGMMVKQKPVQYIFCESPKNHTSNKQQQH
jgi:hypothetical protein